MVRTLARSRESMEAEVVPASSVGAVSGAQREIEAGRRSNPSGFDVSVALVRLAVRVGSRPACNADSLASSGLRAVVAVEIATRAAVDSAGAA